jgi:hypothetical protein
MGSDSIDFPLIKGTGFNCPWESGLLYWQLFLSALKQGTYESATLL